MIAHARRRRRERGFTIVEILVAMTILSIGLLGIVGLQLIATNSSGYSRRATEAAILAEHKLEELRTTPIDEIASGEDVVDASGMPTEDGPFTRTWTVTWNSDLGNVSVRVAWSDSGGDHSIGFVTERLR